MNLLFKNKLYRVLTISRVFNSFGAYLYNIVFVVYAASQYESNLAVYLANIIMVLPSIFSLWIGSKADFTRKKVKWMIATSLAQALLFLLIALIIHQASLLVFSTVCLINVLSDVMSDYSGGLRLPIMQRHVEEEDMMEAYSLIQVATFICTLAGQAVGLWLLEVSQQNFSLIALINAGCFLLSGLVLFLHKNQLSHAPVVLENQPFLKQAKEMLSNMKQIFQSEGSGNFGAVLGGILVLNALGGSIGAIFSIHFLENGMLNLSYGQTIFLLNTLFMVAMIMGSLFSKDYFSKLPIQHMMVLSALVFALMSLTFIVKLPSIIGVLILSFAAYLTGKVTPKIDSLLLANTPTDMLARTNNLLTLLFTLAIPVGTVIFSSLASYNLLLCWSIYFLFSLLSVALSIKALSPIKKKSVILSPAQPS